MNSLAVAPAAQAPSHGPHRPAAPAERAGLQFSPDTFLFGSLPFRIPLLQVAPVSEAAWLSECSTCSTCTCILLARILPLLVYSAHCLLGDTVDPSRFAKGTFVGHSFLNSAHSLDVHSIAFLVDSHPCGPRNNSLFPKRPREPMGGPPPFPFVPVVLVNYWKMAVPVQRSSLSET